VVHCHDFDSLFVGWLLKAGSEKALPLVLTLHRAPSPWRQQRHLEDPKDLFLWTAVCSELNETSVIDAIVVPSLASAEALRYTFVEMRCAKKIAIEPRLHVIKHGISEKLLTFKEQTGLLESLGCTRDRILVFCPCRADEHKDIEVFLDAAGILKRTRPDLLLFFLLASEDRGPDNRQVRHRAKSNRLLRGMDIAFRKFEHEEMATVYRRARVCVVPSRHESFGLVVLEAFLMRVPVIAANSTALAEIVTNRQNGMQFTPGEVQGISGSDRNTLGQRRTAERDRSERESSTRSKWRVQQQTHECRI
jgi:glycosyltransferase involved in cell wall biosynthesis